jgi:hypothetical protein
MKLKKGILLIAALAVANCAMAQQPYPIPFASTDNSVELTVANTSTLPLVGVTIEATGLPGWLRLQEIKQSIALLKANQELPVLFTFSVDKSAPVKQEGTIIFSISSSTGEKWTKEIKIQVAAPEKFELFQNYPNPFNPFTIISYVLPSPCHIKLTVYNLLGQEVATLVDEHKPAGYYRETIDAHRFPSGMYVYQLVLNDEQGKKQIAHKAMLLLK